jgi:phosphatidylinositol phospholipase C gamma-1
MPTNKLREIFQEVDTRKRMELGFDDFAILYHKLMYPDDTVSKNTISQMMQR